VDVYPNGNNGISVFYRDVSLEHESKRRLEAAAREVASEKAKQDAVIEQSPAGIGIVRGPEFIFEKVNHQFTELVGSRDYLGRRWVDVYPEVASSPLPNIMGAVLSTGVPYFAEGQKFKMQVTSGLHIDQYYDLSYSRILDADGRPYGVIIQSSNVTERVESRQKLELTIGELESEREIREKFVATLSHDLRTPLTSAKLNAQLLLRKEASTQVITKLATRITSSIDRAEHMVKDLLDANRIKAGEGIPISVGECNLTELIGSTVTGLRLLHGERFKFEHSNVITGYWDCDTLQRVVENLSTNAVKYGKLNSQVTIDVTSKAHEVEISVHNEGEAISPEDQKLLFQSYQRTKAAVSSGHKGWGIGLTLVKGIAEAHHGSVGIKSNAEHGTTFWFRVPKDCRSFS
ncbi:MAG: hypothetical protein EOP04_23245, partial [Proteobacteria bacterium]